MKIVTCASNTKQVGYIHGLVASCRFFGLDLVTLETKNWTTHRQKDILLKDYLQLRNPDEIVFFTDAYDVLFTNSETEIKQKYAKLYKPGKILISADRICSPDHNLAKFFESSSFGYNFPNTGGMIGKVKDMLNILSKVSQTEVMDKSKENSEYKWSNQYLWTKTIIQYPDLVTLDHNCEIFQTMTNQKVLDELRRFKNHEPALS